MLTTNQNDRSSMQTNIALPIIPAMTTWVNFTVNHELSPEFAYDFLCTVDFLLSLFKSSLQSPRKLIFCEGISNHPKKHIFDKILPCLYSPPILGKFCFCGKVSLILFLLALNIIKMWQTMADVFPKTTSIGSI